MADRLDAEATLALLCVRELQEWIESAEGLSETPHAGFIWTPYTLMVFIGDITVWDDQTREFELTTANLKAAYREAVGQLQAIASAGTPAPEPQTDGK
jgi:hypothetical protein